MTVKEKLEKAACQAAIPALEVTSHNVDNRKTVAMQTRDMFRRDRCSEDQNLNSIPCPILETPRCRDAETP